LDLAVDGADEVDPKMNLIKGLGRAVLREKIVGIHARQFVIIVDESKLVKRLGARVPLPVEISTYEAGAHVRWLNTLGCKAEQWFEEDGSPVVTDNGNYLVRCWFSVGIDDPYRLDRMLLARPGILEHGLFLDMADRVVVASVDRVYEMESER
jgi:ribose 5-phosphate isomerase A